MSREDARDIAETLGGEPFEVADENWLVLIVRADGRMVALSETSVDEYDSRDDFEAGRCCYCCISLA